MFTRLSCRITDKLEHNGTISKSDRALYEYGLRQMFTTLLNILTTLLIGLAMKMVILAIFYILSYIPLRVYAGGYHASTPQRCWIFSAIMLFAVLWILRNLSEEGFCILIVLSLISCVMILILSPVEDLHKPLDETEHRVYRIRAIVILVIEMIAAVIMWLFDAVTGVLVIELVWCSLALMLVLGKLKNRIREDVDE